jgi:hypothetical protein
VDNFIRAVGDITKKVQELPPLPKKNIIRNWMNLLRKV